MPVEKNSAWKDMYHVSYTFAGELNYQIQDDPKGPPPNCLFQCTHCVFPHTSISGASINVLEVLKLYIGTSNFDI